MKVKNFLLFEKPGDQGGAGGKTPEQIAADAAAAAGTKTPEQLAAEKKTTDDAAAAAAAANKGKTPEQLEAERLAAEAAANAAAKPGAPEKYELKLPADAIIQPADLKALEDLARKGNLTNEEAQAALEEHNAFLQAQSESFKALAMADPDYGGDKLAESQQLANSVIDRIRPAGHPRRDAFLGFINRAGASNHPEIVGFLADLGRQMGEDPTVRSRAGGGGQNQRKPNADVMYPNQGKAS
jgi:hypothetical protein